MCWVCDALGLESMAVRNILWLCMRYPQGDSVRYSHLTPQMRQIPMAETEVAKLFQRLVIHETFVVMISRGEPSAIRLASLCEALKTALQSSPASGAILSAVVAEITDVVNCILALHTPTEMSLAHVDKILQSKSGPRLLTCQALMQAPYYAQRLRN